MENYLDRSFGLHHGADVIRLFGLGVYLRLLAEPHKDLLEVVTDWNLAHGIPIPGRMGNAYRLAALLEYRVAQIYGAMAETFGTLAPARELFRDLQEEEIQHGRVMTFCLYTVRAGENVHYIPGVRDPDVQALLAELRRVRRSIPEMTLDDALDQTLQLEQSEVNLIFERLLTQVDDPRSQFIAERLEQAGEHWFTVPPRVERLRAQLRMAA